MSEQAVLTIVFVGLFAVVAWFLWLDSKRKHALVQARSELQNRLLEKFASPQDVAQFLQTEGGRRFLQGLTSEHRHAGRRILWAMQIGVVLSCLGLAAIGLGLLYATRDGGGNPGVILGILGLSLGVGFLISAALSYRLSTQWGILETDGTAVQNG